MRHGLIRKSFVPGKPLRDLRDLLRYRRGLVNAGSTERNRLLKLLETANIKLACVATDVFGVSGMRMLKALIKGDSTPEAMAQLAKGRLRHKRESLELALRGSLDEHHRRMLEMQVQRIERTDQDVQALDLEIEARLEPYRAQHELLMQIPGVEWLVAAVIIAARTGGSYYKNQYFRLKARRGAKRAAMAIAHKILIAVYHVLSTGTPYKELGEMYLDRRNRRAVASSLIHRLRRLGYTVQIAEPLPA